MPYSKSKNRADTSLRTVCLIAIGLGAVAGCAAREASSDGTGPAAGGKETGDSGAPVSSGASNPATDGTDVSMGGVELTIEDIVGRPVEAPTWNCGATCLSELGDAGPLAFQDKPVGTLPPKFLYPLDDSMHPLNLPEITFQWQRASAAQSEFHLQIVGATTYDFYVGCGPIVGAAADDCAYALPEGNWLAITVANRGKSVQATLSAADSSGVSAAAPIALSFSPQAVTGGLYYWSTGIRGTYRLPFGAKKAVPFIVPKTAANPSECGGCHAVSRDGSTIAFTQDKADGYLTLADTTTPEAPRIAPQSPAVHDSSMLTLSPDGKRVLTAFNDGTLPVLELRDTSSGEVLRKVTPADLGGLGGAYFPEFAPDGKAIVVTLSTYPDAEWSVRKGSIAIIPFDPSSDSFGTPKVVVAEDTDFHFYPSWSPDGKWIAFSSAPSTGKLISYNQDSARLRLVSAEGGQVYELGRATQASGRASSWPKFAPFLQAEGNLMFITFNSKIDYGATLKNSELRDQARPQLWMAGIDLRRLDGGDPSYAPIWLPFQEVDQNNHLGYWTEVVTCKVGGCNDEALVCNIGETGGSGECVFVH